MRYLICLLLMFSHIALAGSYWTLPDEMRGASTFKGAQTFDAGATISSGQSLTLTGATVAGSPTWSGTQAFPNIDLGASGTFTFGANAYIDSDFGVGKDFTGSVENVAGTAVGSAGVIAIERDSAAPLSLNRFGGTAVGDLITMLTAGVDKGQIGIGSDHIYFGSSTGYLKAYTTGAFDISAPGLATTIKGTLTADQLATFSAGATVSAAQTLTLTGASVAGSPTWSSDQTFPNVDIATGGTLSFVGTAYIDSQFGVGKTFSGSVTGTTGISLDTAGYVDITRASGSALVLNRTTTDGAALDLYYNSLVVGNISVDASSVSFGNGTNAFKVNTDGTGEFGGTFTLNGTVKLPNLDALEVLVLDASNNVASNSTTGTSGAVVLSNSPTLGGTIGGALSWSGAQTFSAGATIAASQSLKTDDIVEITGAHGVEIDGVVIKDDTIDASVVNAGVHTGLNVSNDASPPGTYPSAGAKINILTSGGGDAYTLAYAGTYWGWGVDNSDSDSWVLSAGATSIDGDVAIKATTNSSLTLGDGTPTGTVTHLIQGATSGFMLALKNHSGSPAIQFLNSAGTQVGAMIADTSSNVSFRTGTNTSPFLTGFNADDSIQIGKDSTTPVHTLYTSTTAGATAGSNGDVPAQVAGYIAIKLNGTTTYKIPYYAN